MEKFELFNLSNKIAVVTGGYGHLGQAICKALLHAGSKVIVAGRNENKFAEVFGETKNIYFEEINLEETASIKTCFERIGDKYQNIDILVNNGVYLLANDAENMTDHEWETGVDGTLNSVFRCIREVIPFMKRNMSGKIINIASMYGMVPPNFKIYKNFERFTNPPNYGVSKAGVIQMTKYYAVYLAKYNINVNSVSPGPFPSSQVQASEEFINNLKDSNPSGRIGKPEDLMGVINFLSSNASSFVTGQNIAVDGGWTVW